MMSLQTSNCSERAQATYQAVLAVLQQDARQAQQCSTSRASTRLVSAPGSSEKQSDSGPPGTSGRGRAASNAPLPWKRMAMCRNPVFTSASIRAAGRIPLHFRQTSSWIASSGYPFEIDFKSKCSLCLYTLSTASRLR